MGDMRGLTRDEHDFEWRTMFGHLLDLPEQAVEVTVSVDGLLVGALRGYVRRGDALPGHDVPVDESVVMFVGNHNAAFVVQRELLTRWEMVEHEDVTRLELEMGSTAVLVDLLRAGE